jgi:hypothetical protein
MQLTGHPFRQKGRRQPAISAWSRWQSNKRRAGVRLHGRMLSGAVGGIGFLLGGGALPTVVGTLANDC